MPLDVHKIDDRIRKLQELRKIAVDQEMSALISEFLVTGEEVRRPISMSSNSPQGQPSLQPPNSHEVADIVKSVLDGGDSARLSGPTAVATPKKS
jgi:hypothetical protein